MGKTRLFAVNFGALTFAYYFFDFVLKFRGHDGKVVDAKDEDLKEAIMHKDFFALNLTADSLTSIDRGLGEILAERIKRGIVTPTIVEDNESLRWFSAMSALDLLDWEREKLKIKNKGETINGKQCA